MHDVRLFLHSNKQTQANEKSIERASKELVKLDEQMGVSVAQFTKVRILLTSVVQASSGISTFYCSESSDIHASGYHVGNIIQSSLKSWRLIEEICNHKTICTA